MEFERVQIPDVARRTMCHVLPLFVFLNRVVGLRGTLCQFDNRILVWTALPFRVGVSLDDALSNLGLEPIPFLVRRFALHPPEYYTDLAEEGPTAIRHALCF